MAFLATCCQGVTLAFVLIVVVSAAPGVHDDASTAAPKGTHPRTYYTTHGSNSLGPSPPFYPAYNSAYPYLRYSPATRTPTIYATATVRPGVVYQTTVRPVTVYQQSTTPTPIYYPNSTRKPPRYHTEYKNYPAYARRDVSAYSSAGGSGPLQAPGLQFYGAPTPWPQGAPFPIYAGTPHTNALRNKYLSELWARAYQDFAYGSPAIPGSYAIPASPHVQHIADPTAYRFGEPLTVAILSYKKK